MSTTSTTATPHTLPSGINDGRYALDPGQAVNKPYLHYEAWLLSALEDLDSVDSDTRGVVRKARKDAVKVIQEELDRLETVKKEEWMRQDISRSRTRDIAITRGVEIIDTGKRIPNLNAVC